MKFLMLIAAAPVEALDGVCRQPSPGYGWEVGLDAITQVADSLEQCCPMCCGIEAIGAFSLWTFSKGTDSSPAQCRCDYKGHDTPTMIPGGRDTLGDCKDYGPSETTTTTPLPPITPSVNPDSLRLVECSDEHCEDCRFLGGYDDRLGLCFTGQCSRFEVCSTQDRWVKDSSEAHGGYVMRDTWHSGQGCTGAPGTKDGPDSSVFRDILDCHYTEPGTPGAGGPYSYWVPFESDAASVV